MAFDEDSFVFWFTYVVNGISTITISFLALWQIYNVYSDFFTESRLSVSHRRRPPELTKSYKYVGYFTICAMLCGSAIGWSIAFTSFSRNLDECKTAWLYNSFTGPAKLFVYLVFVVRLHMVYNGSKYACHINVLRSIGIFLVIYVIALFSWANIYTVKIDELDSDDTTEVTGDDDSTEVYIINDNEEWKILYDRNGYLDNDCTLGAPDIWVAIYAFFDIFVNLIFCVLFIKPIRDVIKNVNSSSRNLEEKSRLSKKMLFVGLKVAILSAVLFISTLTNIILYVVFRLALGPTDHCINSICLALMTPYFPDSKYYQKLCMACICCCDRNGYTKAGAKQHDIDSDNNADAGGGREQTETLSVSTSDADNHDHDMSSGGAVGHGSDIGSAQSGTHNPSSVDTMSAIRIGAHQDGPSKTSLLGQSDNIDETEMAANL